MTADALTEQGDFTQRIQRLENLSRAIEGLPEGGPRDLVTEVVQEILALHGDGLERTLEIIGESGDAAPALMDRLANDHVMKALLLLHGLHPVGLEARVTEALEKVRPYLASHGGNVELLGLDDGVARLRLEGSCHGCQSSAVTLKLAIEDALGVAAPDLAGLVVEGVVEQPAVPAGFIPLSDIGGLTPPPQPSGIWRTLDGLEELGAGSLRQAEVGGAGLVVCHVGSEFYAYRETCPGCGGRLADATLEASTIVCASCARRFDVSRAGRCLDDDRFQLEPLPLLADGPGRARVAVPVMA
ncbi:MAG: NifU family protein [Candidatus Limnocylindria bacterium]